VHSTVVRAYPENRAIYRNKNDGGIKGRIRGWGEKRISREQTVFWKTDGREKVISKKNNNLDGD